jgi:hypothetical protein
MSDSIVHFAFVVEGKGEVEAAPALVRRICYEVLSFYALTTTQPVRVTKTTLIRPGELERAIRLAQIANGGGPVVVLLDADEDCPAVLGPSLKARANGIVEQQALSVIIPKYEFETWFLTAAESLRGARGLRDDLQAPPHPETIRGAQTMADAQHAARQSLPPTVDQAALVHHMDLQAARSCRSFDRLCREIERLIRTPDAARTPTSAGRSPH